MDENNQTEVKDEQYKRSSIVIGGPGQNNQAPDKRQPAETGSQVTAGNPTEPAVDLSRPPLDRLAYYIFEKERATPKEAAAAIGVEEKELLDLVRALEMENVVKGKYTVSGDLTIEKGDVIKAVPRESIAGLLEKVKEKQAELNRGKNTTAEEIIQELHRRIRKNRYNR